MARKPPLGRVPSKAARYASADFGSAATVRGKSKAHGIGLDRIERLAEVSRINAYRAGLVALQ